MNNPPVVSVITIFLNGETFIEQAIASVLAQSFELWELILVDDGSSDASTAIAHRYAEQYAERIHYLEHSGHQNRGMSASRNLGVRHARGRYLAFLDADDVWLPQKLLEQVMILERYPAAAMVYGRTLIWYSWTGRSEDRKRDHYYDLGVQSDTLIRPPTLVPLLLENAYQTPTTCNAMLRREIFDSVGGFEEAFRTMYEDQVFFAKVELQAPVFVASACWAKYRQHPGNSNSESGIVNYYETRAPFLDWLEGYLNPHGARYPAVARALRWELWQCRHPYLGRIIVRGRQRLRGVTRLVKNRRNSSA